MLGADRVLRERTKRKRVMIESGSGEDEDEDEGLHNSKKKRASRDVTINTTTKGCEPFRIMVRRAYGG